MILNVLEVRKQAYRNLRGHHMKLSPNVQQALQRKQLSKSFWKHWDSKYQKYITKKRHGTVSINCALTCKKETACNHLNKLAEELIKTNIFNDAIQLETGDIDTTRVYNHDETLQFVNYGVDGNPNGLVCVGQGESCQRMIRENRECITVHMFVSFGGDIFTSYQGKRYQCPHGPKRSS